MNLTESFLEQFPASSGSSSSSSSSQSYVNSVGAGASSSATATSPSGETSRSSQQIFTPGATSSSASGSASSSPAGVSSSTSVSAPAETAGQSSPADPASSSEANNSSVLEAAAQNQNQPPTQAFAFSFQIGNEQDNILFSSPGRDLWTGYGGADTFALSATGVASVAEADMITDFNAAQGDRLQVSDSLTPEDLFFQAIDINNDGIFDSTAIRLGVQGDILAVALHTVNEFGVTQLSTADVTFSPDSPRPVPIPAPVANSSSNNNGSDSGQPASSSSSSPLIDYVLGTKASNTLVGSSTQDLLIGYEGPDTFVLDAVGVSQLGDADLIIDFNWAEGDRLKPGTGLSISDIRFEAIDLDQNGILESTVIRLGDAGSILAIAQNTVDASGRTLLSTNAFL